MKKYNYNKFFTILFVWACICMFFWFTKDIRKAENTELKENNTEFNETIRHGNKVGSSLEISGVKITYISAEKYVTNNEFIKPKEGYEFYRCEFEFDNVSKKDKAVLAYNFQCYSEDYLCEQVFFGKDDLPLTTLSPGKKVIGAIYFEVPKSAENIILEYEANHFNNNKIIYIIK